MKPSPVTATTFKRLAIGARFVSAQTGDTYRKFSEKRAIKLKPATHETPFVGETHAKIPFARSHAVTVAPSSVTV